MSTTSGLDEKSRRTVKYDGERLERASADSTARGGPVAQTYVSPPTGVCTSAPRGNTSSGRPGCMPGKARTRATTCTLRARGPSCSVVEPEATPTEIAGNEALLAASVATAARTSGGQCAASTRVRLGGAATAPAETRPSASRPASNPSDTVVTGNGSAGGTAAAPSTRPWTSEPFETSAFSVLLRASD